MRIEKVDFDNYEVILDCYGYPKETLIFEPNDQDVMSPSFMRVVEFPPKEGNTVTITVAENGFIFKSGKRISVESKNSYDFDRTMKSYLNHEVESERELTDDEREDSDLETISFKMNVKYKGGQVEHSET